MKEPIGTLLVLTMICANPLHAQSPEGTWHGERAGVRFYPSGENLAYDRPAATVHPDLTAHSQKMVPGVYQVAESVYLAYGYALTSPAMIVGDDGVIIVDPPEDVTTGRRTLEEFRKFSDKPVKAVIYSHWHIDHYAGVAAFASLEDAASGDVAIIAHKDFLGNMIKNSTGGTGPIIAARVDYSLGTLLDVGPEGRINGGLGPDFVVENPSLIAPNVLVDEVLDTTIAGVRMQIKWLPSEAPGTGPQFGILTSSSNVYENNVQPDDELQYSQESQLGWSTFDFGWAFEFTYNVSQAREGKGLNVHVRYTKGLTDILENNPGDAVTNSVLQIFLSFPFIGTSEEEKE